jgi:probable rRNA maturation factor
MSHDSVPLGVSSDAFEILLSNNQSRYAVDGEQLVAAARAVLLESDFSSAMISLAVVDDGTIQELNRQFLNHDYPTDVLSFALQDDGTHLEGEVIISADTAAATAAELGCTATAEQLLYVVHGVLHLMGYRDKSPAEAQLMRTAEARILGQFGWDATFHNACGDADAAQVNAAKSPDGASSL